MPEEIMTPKITPEGGEEMITPEGEIDNDKIERVLAVFTALTPEEKTIVFDRIAEEMKLNVEEEVISPVNEEMANYGAIDNRLQEL